MSTISLIVIGIAVLSSSFVSGVFGFAGGMLLLGVLLVFFDVPTAMVMFSLLVMTGNAWRVVAWWRHIRWSICLGYLAGGLIALLALRSIEFVPSKALVYLMLGMIPFSIELLPRTWHPNIEWRGASVFSGLLTTTIQLIAGNGGVFLDIFFQKSTIDRRTTVVTKAFCRTFGNLARIFYFGTVAGIDPSFPLWVFVPMILLAIGGTALAPLLLNRMTEVSFRQWTHTLIFFVGAIYIARAAWLFFEG
ncbi:MAG: TSUP family transporter [Xanthobacteraceae bacterium]